MVAAAAAGARATDRFDFVDIHEAGGDSRLFVL
jgi:hypothetical protein